MKNKVFIPTTTYHTVEEFKDWLIEERGLKDESLNQAFSRDFDKVDGDNQKMLDEIGETMENIIVNMAEMEREQLRWQTVLNGLQAYANYLNDIILNGDVDSEN